MKKRLFGIFLALTLAFTCFAVAACGKKEEKPIGDPVTVELAYAEDTGILSWSAVEGATKYTIRLNNVNDSAKSEVTTATSLQLYLRRGSTRISLIAEDEQGRERGNGTKTVTLESDFGAPAQVTGIAYDKAAGTLGWTASEGAVKYLVSATSVNNDEFVAVADAEATATSYAVALGKGVYDVSVVAVNDKGAKSIAANYRYASYVDPAYGTEITEGVYKLFDFEDENVTDLSRFASDYKAWSQENKKPEWAIVNKHEKSEDSPEDDTVEFTSNALKVRAAYNEEGDNVTRTSAVTFTLPEPLEKWGRIYYDMFRTLNPSAGVLLTDVTGKRVLKSVEYSHGATLGKWGTVSFTRSEVLESEPEFGALAEISFVLVNGKGGVAYFDNVRYDMVDLGYFGNCGYVRSTDTFTFDEVSGAKKYEMYVDGATDQIELTQAEYVFDPALTAGNHSIRIVAINGESTREHTFDLEVGERPAFNVENPTGSGEYVLADFNTVEYREYFATTARTSLGRYYNYAIADGKLNITHNEDWGNGYLLYTLPEAIDGAKVVYFNGIATSHKYYIGVVYRDTWTSGDETTNMETIRGDALGTAKDLVYTVPAERAGNPIVAIKIMASYESDANGVEKTISLDSITYLTENGIGKLGDDCKYVRSTDVFTFGAAYNAESYDVYVDGATDPISCDTASCDLSANPLAAGTHSIRVVAKRGDASRERTYSLTVGEKIKFNVETAEGSTEYILADFETVEYREYLEVAGKNYNWGGTKYSIGGGELVIDPLVESGYNQVVKYTFPEPITKADIHHIRIKLTTTETIRLFAFDENGNKTEAGWLSNPRTEMGVATYYDFTTLEGDKVSAIAFTLNDWQKQSVVHVEEITYIKYAPVTGFNSEIAGTSDRLLADFNASGYRDHISVAGAHANYGATKWSVGFGYLTIDPLVENGYNQVVKYTFPEPITKANILNIKVKFSTTNSIKIYAFDERGNKTGTDSDGEWLGGTGDMAVSTYTGFRSLAGDKITAIAFTLHNWQTQAVVKIDEITYEYIDPVTNFNTKVEGTENEYLLADFSVSGYKQYITLENAAYSISDNKLVVTSNKGWGGVSVKYTLPEAITGAGEIRIKVAASDQVRLFNVYFADSSSITAATPAKGAVTLAIPIPADKRSLAVTAVEVGAVNATDNETRTVEVDEITYIPYTAETAFNSAVTDVENGKLLADFNANGYYDYLTIEGGTTWGNQPTKTIEGGALTMSLTLTQLNRYVKYAFASAIDKDDILTLSFIAKSSTDYRVYVFDEAGNSAYRNFGASENYVTNANALSGYADYAKLTGKIVAIGFASNYVDCYKDGQATVLTVDRIAYEYCDKITGFNQLVSGSTTEYQLAKFDVNGYKNYLSLAGAQSDWGGQQSSYTLSDGNINVVSRRNWSNSYIKYTFPTALDKNTVGEVKFNYTVESGKTALFYLFDENGNSVHVNGSSSATEVTILANSVGSLAGSKVVAIGISSTEANVENSIFVNITVSQISYEKLDPVTNFNTKVEGTENEYLLADFSVNGYKQYLQNVGSGKYTLVENGLSVTGANWDNNAVKYTLPSSIAVGDIEKIKVEFIVTGGKHGVVRASDGTNYSGTNTDVSPMEFTIDTAKVTGDKIVSFLLSCNDTSTAIVYTKITYVKKSA